GFGAVRTIELCHRRLTILTSWAVCIKHGESQSFGHCNDLVRRDPRSAFVTSYKSTMNRPRISRQSRSSKNNAFRIPQAVAAAHNHVVVYGCKTFQCSQRRQPWPVPAWDRLFDEYARV